MEAEVVNCLDQLKEIVKASNSASRLVYQRDLEKLLAYDLNVTMQSDSKSTNGHQRSQGNQKTSKNHVPTAKRNETTC